MARTSFDRRALLKAAGASWCGASLGCNGTPLLGGYTLGTRAYPRDVSLFPGQALFLHVSTPAPQFRVELYRVGAERELLQSSDWLPGIDASISRPDEDWQFPVYPMELEPQVRPGVYVAHVVEGAGNEPLETPSFAARDGLNNALFIVRTPSPASRRILYKLALATYHAYNFTGGASLYHVATDSAGEPLFHLRHPAGPGHPAGTKLTLRRPGGGHGADTAEPPDVYDRRSIRNTFEHWDAHFIRWLEREGFEVDYCFGLDVHRESDLLLPYSTLLCAGHDEYWSEPERNHIEDFLHTGGKIGFFSGNTCWWRVHYVDDDTALICDKHGHLAPDQWHGFRAEDSLTGVSYRFGGGRWKGYRPVVGYEVQRPEHWAFAGTGLERGDVFGADPSQPLVGYECDSAPYRLDGSGTAVIADPTRHGTPPTFEILGLAELSRVWSRKNGHSATMGAFMVEGGGEVFNAATTDWVKLLERDPTVARITRNVIERFSTVDS